MQKHPEMSPEMPPEMPPGDQKMSTAEDMLHVVCSVATKKKNQCWANQLRSKWLLGKPPGLGCWDEIVSSSKKTLGEHILGLG